MRTSRLQPIEGGREGNRADSYVVVLHAFGYAVYVGAPAWESAPSKPAHIEQQMLVVKVR